MPVSLKLPIRNAILLLQGQSYDDKRCKCICPSLKTVKNSTQTGDDRILFIDNVPPNKW